MKSPIRCVSFFFAALIVLLPLTSVQAQLPVTIGHAHLNMSFLIDDVIDWFEFLNENDYNTITPEQFYNWRVHGEPLPIRPILLTFDDNYIKTYTELFPACQAHSITLVNFAHTDFVGLTGGTPDCEKADWNAIREMEADGAILTESHSRTHPYLTSLSLPALRDELVGSRQAIESEIPGKTCSHMAYPYGDYDATVLFETEAAGYLMGYTTINQLNYRDTPLFEIRRIGVDGANVETFKTRIGFYNLPDAPPGEGWTIDNFDPNFYADSTAWTTASGNGTQYGSDYQVRTPGDGSQPAEWAAYLPEEGSYRVYAWWPDVAGLASNAEYEIEDFFGIHSEPVNQQTQGGQWNLLGTYFFTTDIPARVRLLDSGDGQLAADGIWFEIDPSDIPQWMIY